MVWQYVNSSCAQVSRYIQTLERHDWLFVFALVVLAGVLCMSSMGKRAI